MIAVLHKLAGRRRIVAAPWYGKRTMHNTDTSINSLPRYHGKIRLTARICWKMIESILVFKWLLSMSRCQDMQEIHGLNMPEVAQTYVPFLTGILLHLSRFINNAILLDVYLLFSAPHFPKEKRYTITTKICVASHLQPQPEL